MSSSFWASGATKKRNELVPGTSKWVANELSTVNDVVLTHNEQVFQTLQEGLDHMNSFMRRVLAGQNDREAVRDMLAVRHPNNTSPSNFTYISPSFPPTKTSNSPQSSPTIVKKAKPAPKQFQHEQDVPVRKQLSPNVSSANHTRFTPKTPSPLKPVEQSLNTSPNDKTYPSRTSQQTSSIVKTSPLDETSPIPEPKNFDSSFIPIANTIDPNKKVSEYTSTRESPHSAGLDDSFQAISTAIRKSIAGKTQRIEAPQDQETSQKDIEPTEHHEKIRSESQKNSEEPSSRISMPLKDEPSKRTTKTPKRSSIFVSLPSREPITISSSKSKRLTGVRTGSSRVFERLDIASRRETNLNKNLILSPVPIPNDVELSKSKARAGTLPKATRRKTESPTRVAEVKVEQNSKKASSSSEKQAPPKLQETKIPSLQKSTKSTSPDEAQKEKQIPSYMRTTSSRSNSSSPVRRSPRRSPRKGSPVQKVTTHPVEKPKSPRRKSPTKSRDQESEEPVTSSETPGKELINRLMVPTSSSAAKNKTPGKIAKQSTDKKHESVSTKNRFLTTTLIPSNPQFNPQKPPQYNRNTRLIPSPTKKNGVEEYKAPLKLESAPIPSLKKKSMMAERSEAAAQKPKQKIMISMNHKLDLKPSYSADGTVPKEKESKRKLQSYTVEVKPIGNSVPLPEVARGNLTKPGDVKRRKTAKKETKVYQDILPSEFSRPDESPDSVKKSILGKKASRLSGSERKTPYRHNASDPRTPGSSNNQHSSVLPDIHTDEEDGDTKYKILKSWGHTPELHKIVMQNREVNPATVFGDVPKLNIEDIFESQASRHRGRQSPNLSPDEKQRKHEERQYVLEMGYK